MSSKERADSTRLLSGLTIAHVTTVHDPRDTRIRHKECASLVQAGAQVYLIAPDSTADGRPTEDATGLRLISIKRRRKLSRPFLAGVEAVRRVRRIKPEIVHFHDPELLLMAPLFRLFGASVIYDVHEDTPRQLAGREWIWKPLCWALVRLVDKGEPFLARACHGFVMVENWTRRFPSRPTAIIRNLPLRREFDERCSVESAEPIIVYLGSITEERGALDLVSAVNEVRAHCSLVLAGPVQSQLAERLNLTDRHDRLQLAGFLDRSDAIGLLKRAAIGVLLLRRTPAYDTALATKLHEYALAGLPMVLSDTTAHRQFASEYQCALVVDGQDPTAVAEAIDSIIENKPMRDDLREHALNAATRAETWESEAGRLIDLYLELATP